MTGFLAGLECTRCSDYYPGDTARALCDCGSTLLVRYDLAGVRKAITPDDIARRPPTMWRYRELLPVRDEASIVTMGEGFTPMIPVPKAARETGVGELWVDGDVPVWHELLGGIDRPPRCFGRTTAASRCSSADVETDPRSISEVARALSPVSRRSCAPDTA